MITDIFSLKGKVALVTGASSGIGAQCARTFAAAGASVAVAARRKDRLDALVAELEGAGFTAMAVEMDVTDNASVVAGYDAIEATFGTPDVVVCNAGVGKAGWSFEVSEEDYDFQMDVNMKGVWRTANEAARRMIKAGKAGSIINTASILGLNATKTSTIYCASKAAVVNFTKAMALDMIRFKIRVNAICPGYFKTEINDTALESEAGQAMIKMTPARRIGDLEELSGLLLLLASDAGSFMTGTAIPVDGGHTASVI